MKLTKTHVEKITFDNFDFYLKRDDLIHPDFSGNKARKFYYLLQQDLSNVDKLIGFGSPQANSLHSLAVLAKDKKVKLDFYVNHIPSFLQQNPAGNYLAALNHGANIIEVGQLKDGQTLERYVVQQVLPNESNCQYVPEGGRYQDAAVGVNLLADEIADWAASQKIEQLNVALPSGTGTTALFLQKRFVQLSLPFEVLTCACVGGDDYLKAQFNELSNVDSHHPTILPTTKKYHFGKLYPEFYQIWQQLKRQTGVEFELLYDPLGWMTLLEYVKQAAGDTPIMYVHQGGVLGNATMLPRYARKFG
ncbi:MAG: 1-aminocyclopropane-1-carboxylate deaminase/D-cysteine desulfhydrase [Algicola sp.]|nr:1-aminocyclopropane-1-carboxylate deaminase/D-cysteine desulfhydrase [Algicola sp.]